MSLHTEFRVCHVHHFGGSAGIHGALTPLIEEQRKLGYHIASCALLSETKNQFIEKLQALGHFDIYHIHLPILSDMVLADRDKFGKAIFIGTRHAALGVLPYPTSYLKHDGVICVSQAIGREVLRHGVAVSKVKVIGNGVNLDKFTIERNKAKRDMGIDEDIITIGFSGRLDRIKNIHNIIKSVIPAIRSVKKRVQLYLMGRGRLDNSLRLLVTEMNAHDVVKFLGFSTFDDHIRRVCAMDISVLYSLSEGCSISLLEAMAAASIPIVSNIEGNREVVGNSGIVVDVDNPPKLTMELTKLLTIGKSDLGDKARKRCLAYYSIEKSASEHDQFYRACSQRKKEQIIQKK